MNLGENKANAVLRGLGLVVLVCVGVRIAAALVAPVMPALVALAALVFIVTVVFRGAFFRK